MSFFESFQKLVPSWLSADDGGKVLASLALIKDDFVARAKLALLARFPNYAPDDAALAAIGRDRRIMRGINEPAASYATREVRYLDDHIRRGNPFAMLEQLQAYLQAPCVVRTVDRRGNWYSIAADGTKSTHMAAGNWTWDDQPTSLWARFWVIIYPAGGTNPWAPSGAHLNDAGLWGDDKLGHANLSIGTTATQDQIATVKAIIRDWKPAGSNCEWAIIAFDATSFSPTGALTDPGGLWGNWSDGSGHPVRLSMARYWAIGAKRGL